MSLILIIVLILLLFGGVGTLPHWQYSANYGYGPSSIIGILLVAILVLFFLGRF